MRKVLSTVFEGKPVSIELREGTTFIRYRNISCHLEALKRSSGLRIAVLARLELDILELDDQDWRNYVWSKVCNQEGVN